MPAVALANSPEDGAEEDALVISDKEGLRGAFGDLKAATGAALEVKAELVEACAASRSAPCPLRPVDFLTGFLFEPFYTPQTA